MKKIISISLILVFAAFINIAAQNRKLDLVVQTGHSGRVAAGAFSPNGKTIASASDDKTIKIWDAASGQELRTLRRDDHDPSAVVYAPDSKTIASISGLDKTLKIWSIETGQELKSIQTGHADYVYSLAFSADGKTIATCSKDSTIKLWEALTGQLAKTLTGHTKDVKYVAFTPDGKTLISTGDDETIRFWNVETGQETKKISVINRINSEQTNGAAFSNPSFTSDGKYFTAGGFHSVKVWATESGQEVLDIPAADGEVAFGGLGSLNSFFSPDNQMLVIGGYEKKFKLLDSRTRQAKDLSNADNSKLFGFSPDSKKILTGNTGYLPADQKTAGSNPSGTLRVLNVETPNQSLTLERRAGITDQILFSPDGQTLAASEFATNLIRLWDFRGGRSELRVLQGKNDRVRQITFSPNGKFLASSSWQDVTWDQIVRIWDVETGNLIRTLPAVDGVYSTLVFSPDSKILAHITKPAQEPLITLWNVETGQLIRVIKTGQTQGIWDSSAAFSPDGKTISCGSLDGTIKIWQTATGRELKTLGKIYDGSVSRLVFSHDGKILAAGYNTTESHVKLWDLQTGREMKKFPVAGDPNILEFSSDDKTILTASYFRALKRWNDKSIRLWNVADGRQTEIFNRDDPATVRKLLAVVPDFYFKSTTEPVTHDKKLQAVETENGKLTLLDARSNRELINLVALGQGDWLTTAPNGLFDGTPAAWKQIIWRFDGNTFSYAPVEAFFKEFYYPGLLSEILSGKNPPAPQDITQIDIRQPRVRISEIAGLNQSAADNPPITQRTATIKIEVTDNFDKPQMENFPLSSGAADLRLFRNGSLVKLWANDVFTLTEKDGCAQFPANKNSPRRAVCQVDLPIVAGSNRFAAYAFNHQNVKSNDAFFETSGADSLKRAGTLYILAIGVNKYAAESHNLAFAVADVEAVGKEISNNQTKLLQKQFAKTEIIQLLDEQATKANILLALKKFGGDKSVVSPDFSPELKNEFARINPTAPEDALVIYYAGHGTASKNNFYLIPHDGFPVEKFSDDAARLAKLYAGSISDGDLQNVLEKINAGKMLMIIDACNSGQALESEEKRRGPMNSKGLAQLAFEKGMYILTAAQSRQSALEISKLGHGLLTYTLLESFQKAEKDLNGNITERKWLDFATAEVPQLQLAAMKIRNAENKSAPPAKKRSELAVATGDDANLPPEKRGLQVPRIFYRRELEANQLIMAKP